MTPTIHFSAPEGAPATSVAPSKGPAGAPAALNQE